MRHLLIAACAAIASLALAAPTVDKGADAWTLRHGDCSFAISLKDGITTFHGPAAEFTITPYLQLGDGWTRTEPATVTPTVRAGKGQTTLTVVLPVAEERQFTIVATAHDDLPAIFVTTRLAVLKHTRGQYYFLQTSLPVDHYVTAGGKGPEAVTLDKTAWASMPWRPWWFIHREKGGIAILPTNLGGRAPGENSAPFLHALPRGTTLCPGDSLDASFGLANVADAAAAEKLYEAARARTTAALESRAPETTRDYGKPAPKWLREAEVYNLYYRPAAMWTDEVVNGKLKGFPLIVGSTPDKAALDRCHKAGIKLLHYVVYTCLLDTALQVKAGGQVYSEWTESIDCENRDLAKHPDWVCVDKDGKTQHDAWGMEHGHKGLLNTCLHQPGLREAALRQVRMLMELGYDGVFIDLAGPTVECYGDKHGQHKHEHPEWTNTEAYEALLKDIYATVKRFGNDRTAFGSDRIVMQNTCTGIIEDHWASCDSQMLEAWPYSAGSAELRVPPPELRWQMLREAEAVKHGKVPVVLPYFGGTTDLEAVKRAAQTSRAWARLAGFLWADAFGLQDIKGLEEWSRGLYRGRLGKPKGRLEDDGGVFSREHANGTPWLNLMPWPVGGLPGQSGGFTPPPPPRHQRLPTRVGRWRGRIPSGPSFAAPVAMCNPPPTAGRMISGPSNGYGSNSIASPTT